MKYSKIIENDTINCIEGISVTLFMSGCPHHCKGCFNQETWDLNYGTEITVESLCDKLNKLINAYGVKRNFSILGGEPLAEWNRKNTLFIIREIKRRNPQIFIYLWTGYTMNELKVINDGTIDKILKEIDCLIDGRFEEDKKDIDLKLRGSSNQDVYIRKNGELLHVDI